MKAEIRYRVGFEHETKPVGWVIYRETYDLESGLVVDRFLAARFEELRGTGAPNEAALFQRFIHGGGQIQNDSDTKLSLDEEAAERRAALYEEGKL